MDTETGPTMATGVSTLSQKLERYRAAGFVGRDHELAAFEETLDPASVRRILLVTGASGVGKTTLLGAFERSARRRAVDCIRIDSRDLPSDPACLAADLDARLAACTTTPALLLIDAFEYIEGHERWLREHYLPRQADTLRIVIAGCWEPDDAWTADSGWATLAHTCRLADFDVAEVATCLARHNLGEEQARRVYRFTHGHPLAVGLVAALLAEDAERPLELESTPEVVRALVERHLDSTPDEHKRLTLFAAGLARNLTEDMLAAMLGCEDAHAEFEWLRRRSFVSSGMQGVRAHELVGDALRVELKWREPRLHRQLVRRATAHLLERFRTDASESAVQDFLFTVREHPALRRVFVIEQDTGLYTDTATEADLSALAAIVERHEGPDGRAWFEYWAQRHGEGIRVLRDGAGDIAGFALYIDASAVDSIGRTDPAVAALREHLTLHAPLRAGEQAHLCRFVMAADSYQTPSAAMTQLLCHNAFRPFRRPGLAFQASVRREDEAARAQARYAGVPPLAGTAFRLDGRAYFLMGHDWRSEPPTQWVRNFIERVLADDGDTTHETRMGTVLDETAFGAAVEHALTTYARDRDLSGNPIADSCLARSLAQEDDDIRAKVVHILKAGVEDLRKAPQTENLARVLDRTYLNPAPKQRAAAEALGLSYGTYRRRLRQARRALVDHLWRRELEAARTDR